MTVAPCEAMIDDVRARIWREVYRRRVSVAERETAPADERREG